ncbi:hypothetical protein D3C87_2036800 [compost metagenome]
MRRNRLLTRILTRATTSAVASTKAARRGRCGISQCQTSRISVTSNLPRISRPAATGSAMDAITSGWDWSTGVMPITERTEFCQVLA